MSPRLHADRRWRWCRAAAIEAHSWFRARIDQHVGQGANYQEFRLEKLFEALQAGLRVVSIELEGGDDSQTIFETLSSRGVDLSLGDPMRNFIFQRAKGMGQHAGDQLMRELERDQSINKLGNLILLTHSLNASQSNGAFSAKMPAVRARKPRA